MTETINWQAKYLEQIDARLAGLQHGQERLEAKIQETNTRVDQVRDVLSVEIRGVRDDLRSEIGGTRDDLRSEIGGTRDDLRSEIGEVRNDVREVRNLIWGMLAVVVTAIVGAVLRALL